MHVAVRTQYVASVITYAIRSKRTATIAIMITADDLVVAEPLLLCLEIVASYV